ncbi:hypothetical protein TNCV_4169621 [Trichonephila clavipes]|nr:hypothetical protein TNCV_4169621 [Trichonephila clavipes]
MVNLNPLGFLQIKFFQTLRESLGPSKEVWITTTAGHLTVLVAFYCSQTQDLLSRYRPPIDIFGNEQVDNVAKEAQNSPQLSKSLTLTDDYALARSKLTSHSVRNVLSRS